MPTSPGYSYFKTYGVEPWKAIAGKDDGGAEVTGDNLIITLWRITEKVTEGDEILADMFGPILTPLDVVDTTPDSQKAAFVQSMHGRVGAQFQLFVGDDALWNADAPGEESFEGLLAVCAPPTELKQQLANSVEFIGGTPSGDPSEPLPVENYNFLKPQSGQFSWEMRNTVCFNPNARIDPGGGDSLQTGQYVPLNVTDAGDGWDETFIPLLKTNGADGETPEFFDMKTTAGAQECIAAVNAGKFFVPAMIPILGFAGSDGTAYEIRWPYSASRG